MSSQRSLTFRRGATLTTATTLGHSDTSNLGPTAGNGFYKRWPDDLALLHELGIDDIRLTIDWARLQPKPGDFDGDWAERFENILVAADAIGMRVWATLHDGAVPRWIDNEGGFGDAETMTRWWPRWAERVAERFGDQVHGWVPLAGIDADMPVQAWKDMWGILEGGDAPVVASIGADDLDTIPRYLEMSDRIGVVLDARVATDHEPTDDDLDQLTEQLGRTIHDAAEAAPDEPLLVTQFTPHNDDPDSAAQLVERFVAAADQAIDDGIDIDVAFLDPAIAGPDSPIGLLDKDRSPQPAAAAFVPTSAES